MNWLAPTTWSRRVELNSFPQDFQVLLQDHGFSRDSYRVLHIPIEDIHVETLEDFDAAGDDRELGENGEFNPAYLFYFRDRMAKGSDFPPIVVGNPEKDRTPGMVEKWGFPYDGRHRLWAAKELGLRVVPGIDVSTENQLTGLGATRRAKRQPTIACGECFPWATKFAQDKPGAVIVHGYITPPHYSKPHIPHAWVEWNGYVYDWQREVYQMGPLDLDEFRFRMHPRETARYYPTQALVMSARTRHWGPW